MRNEIAIFILGWSIGVLCLHLLVQHNAGNAFKSGNAEAWRDIVTLMNDRRLIQGPLEVNEPNTTVVNCVFISLTPNDYDTPFDCQFGVDAVNCVAANNLFVTAEIMRTIKGRDFPYEHFWATDAETAIVEHLEVK